MKGRAAPHHLRKLPRSRGPPDGSHLWRPGAGAAATQAGRRRRGHVERGAGEPEAAISARDLITRWTLSRCLKKQEIHLKGRQIASRPSSHLL